MDLNVTETFERTSDVYYDLLSKEEYKIKVIKHKEQDLPGIPSKFRYRMIVSMGGSRSSKSYSILQLLMLEMIRRKNIKITVWRNIKTVCKSTVMEDFQKIIMFDDNIFENFKENKQSATFTYIPTGSKIVFTGADDIGKVLGGAQDISFFNEVTEFNKEVFLQIAQRTSDRIICDYNPSKDFWLESYRFDEETAFIHSTFMHNEYCPPEIVKQLLSYEPWLPGSYDVKGTEIYYKGRIISKTNQPPPHPVNIKRGSAHKFNWLVYGLGIGAEKPNRIYSGWTVVTQEEYDSLPYEEYFGIDFGSSNPTAVVGVKYDGDGGFYICLKMYKAIKDLDNNIPTTLKKYCPEIKPNSMIVADSAKQAYIDSLNNNGYYCLGAIKGAGSVDSGITNVDKSSIFYVQSKQLHDEYTTYSWMTDRYGKATDVPLKKDDHAMDAIRYIINYLIVWLNIKV